MPALLSAALIVRDEGHHLAECLASLRGIADEIVVVDTGSTDDSAAIARDHGARVLEHAWTGSFSEARNFGLSHTLGRWVLYLDADERVRPGLDRERVLARLQQADEVALRILLRPFVHATPFFEYRLWRNDPEIRFTGLIHEQVVDAIQAVAARDGRRISDWSELELDHVGYEGDQAAKHLRNLPLLEEQLRLEPENVFNWRHLARVLAGLGRLADAERVLERAVALARVQEPPGSDGSLAWADLVRLRHARGADVEALLEEGRELWPRQWLLVWIEGHVNLDRGRLETAERCWRSLLAVDVDALPAGGVAYDERIFGRYALELLALTLFRAGRYRDAADAWGEAERRDPAQLGYRAKRMLAQARAERAGGGR